ncbi:MAG: polysaccharide biosynthesis tyrosine autokinase [Flavobacterium sp.]
MENVQFENNEKENSFDIIRLVFSYLRYWYFFLISVIICFFAVKYYLNHTVSVYESKASVKIIDDSKSDFSMPTSNGGLSFFGKTGVNLDNEIAIFYSHRIQEIVCRSLNLNTQYYKVCYFNNIELWKNRPFTIEWMDSSVEMDNTSISFEIEITNSGYKITKFNEGVTNKDCHFNVVENIDKFKFKLSKQIGVDLKILNGQKFLINHSSINNEILGLLSDIKIVNTNEKADILTISIKGANKDKIEAVINEIIKQYENDGVIDRRLVYQKTIDFINNRFKSIEQDLDSIETDKARYKKDNELTFLEADAGSISEQKILKKNDVFQIETQIALSKILEQTVKTDSKHDLIPSNIGVFSEEVNKIIADYNSVVLERERILVSGGAKNPVVTAINDKLSQLQKNILQSLKSYQAEMEVSLSKNNYFKKVTSDKFSAIPNDEKVLNAIERQRAIKEALYILLLQKREEAAINLAITSSTVKVVDYALTDSIPVAPVKSIYISGSILAGLAIPFLILFTIFLLDDKIHTKEDLLKRVKNKIVIAEIPHIDSEERLTGVNDRSLLGEAFRILRTNLSYVLPLKPDNLGQVILVTSTIKGEGKTFATINLAISYSLMNKKVLLIGSDLRNPQLHNYVNVKKESIGLQDFLHNTSINLKDITNINQLGNDNLDIIFSGKIPPNPAELLSNGRLEKLLEEAKKVYDLIIFDTAPTLLVADTLMISQLADTTLYIVRAGFTPKGILEYSLGLSEQNKLKNLVYLVNNIGMSDSYGYGYKYAYKYNYGYGYGYGGDNDVKKSLLKKIFSFFIRKKK